VKNVKETLAERGSTHGPYKGNAEIAQRLKRVVREYDSHLTDQHKEALDMILHKIARVLNGDPLFIDAVRDIAGYAQCLIDELLTTEGATDVQVTKIKLVKGVWKKVAK
jgi:hypothetical protein